MADQAPPLPVEKLHGLTIVVDDLPRVTQEFGRFFGIARWYVRRLKTGDGMRIITSAGEREGELLWASGATANLHFDLVQPVAGETVFSDFIARRGPGVLDICVSALTPEGLTETLPKLRRDGVGVLQTLRFGADRAIHYLDSVGQLGTVVSVRELPAADADLFEGTPAGEVIEVELGAEADRLPIDRPYHVCVLTRDRRLSVRDGFRRILGVEDWFEYDNEAGVTSADATYYGKPVEGRFRLALGRRGKFAVEVVEMMFGDNVYQDMLDTRGEGIHHVMTSILSPDRLESALAGLTSDGFTMVQDGKAGTIYYGYLAAEGKLADLAVEVLSTATDDPAADFGAEPWAILKGPTY